MVSGENTRLIERTISIRSGRALIEPGNIADRFFILKSGCITQMLFDEESDNISFTINTYQKGSLICFPQAMTGETHRFFYFADSDATLTYFLAEEVWKLFKEQDPYKDIITFLIAQLSKIVLTTENKLFEALGYMKKTNKLEIERLKNTLAEQEAMAQSVDELLKTVVGVVVRKEKS